MKWLFCIFLLCLDMARGIAQTAAEKLSYLKKNIQLWVVHQPNADSLDIRAINPEGVFLDTDGIIMGQKNNNKLEGCAKLLSALFKDPSKSVNGGEMRFQNSMYYLLNKLNKPVEIYFINDEIAPIQPAYLKNYMTYLSTAGRGRYVSCATYKPRDAAHAGAIVMGGSEVESNIGRGKRLLLFSLAKLVMNNFSPALNWGVGRLENKNPGPGIYKNDPLMFTAPGADIRYSIPDACAYSFIHDFMPGISKSNYEWLQSPLVLVPVNRFFDTVPGAAAVPAEYFLYNKLRDQHSGMVDTGRFITGKPFDTYEVQVQRSWKLYMLKALSNSMMIRNELLLSLLLYEWRIRNGNDNFLEAVSSGSSGMLSLAPDEQLLSLFSGLSGYQRNPNGSFSESAIFKNKEGKEHLFALALADLVFDFPVEGNVTTNLSKIDPTFFGLFPANRFPKTVIEEYFSERPNIYELAERTNKKKGFDYINSGSDNFLGIVDAVWLYLQSK